MILYILVLEIVAHNTSGSQKSGRFCSYIKLASGAKTTQCNAASQVGMYVISVMLIAKQVLNNLRLVLSTAVWKNDFTGTKSESVVLKCDSICTVRQLPSVSMA